MEPSYSWPPCHVSAHVFPRDPGKQNAESSKHSLTSAGNGSCRGKSWEQLNICDERRNTLLARRPLAMLLAHANPPPEFLCLERLLETLTYRSHMVPEASDCS